MHHFSYLNGELYAEDVSITELVEKYGSPLYIYSTATIERHADVMKEALSFLNPNLAYAIKANSNISVLKTLANKGYGADVVSIGELMKALKAGISPKKILFSGVGKEKHELEYAIENDIYQINVETFQEIDIIKAIAKEQNKRVNIVFRINPNIGAGGHAKITTGTEENKFGVSIDEAVEGIKALYNNENIKPCGFAVHIGSQIMDLAPLKDAFTVLKNLTLKLKNEGYEISRLDLGGGLGVPYDTSHSPSPKAYGEMIGEVFDKKFRDENKIEFSFEPGRVIMANAGILVSKAIYVTKRSKKKFLVIDAAMNDLLRPSLYEAYHDIWPVTEAKIDDEDYKETYDVVGPICETGDTFAKNRKLTTIQVGDLVAIMSAGAYGYAMASNYNLRVKVAEVIVKGDKHYLTTKRQSYDELLNQDSAADWL